MLCEQVADSKKCSHKAMRAVRVGRKGPFRKVYKFCWTHVRETQKTCQYVAVLGAV